jgi:hypothetical protein
MHLTAAKKTLRYLKSPQNMTICYGQPQSSTNKLNRGSILEGFTDSNWAGNEALRISIGGCVFYAFGSPVGWQAKYQSVVALSTIEMEYITCSDETREVIWLKRLLAEITTKSEDDFGPPPIGCNNQGAVKLIESGVVKAKSKHIAVKHHHIHDEHKKGEINVYHVSSEDNVAVRK